MLDAAARKGVTLEIVTFDESTHTAADAAAAVGAEVGQIVKSLVFVADATTARSRIWSSSVAPTRSTSRCSRPS